MFMIKGSHHSEESNIKNRVAHLGKQQSKESNLKHSISQSGNKNHFYGKKHTEESLNKMREAHKNMSEETRRKMSIAKTGYVPWNKGKTGIYSEEQKKKMSESKKGKHPTEETKKRMSESGKGRIFSEEHKRKIGKALKGRVFSKDTINKMRRARIGKPLSEEIKKKMSASRQGDKHPNWQGGLSYLPYCPKFNNELKESIRKRDNYTCQNPDCQLTQTESISLYTLSLCVHHVHYDKENCYPDLITICNVCNLKANNHKKFHEQLYMNILNNKEMLFWTKQNVKL